MAKEIKLLTDNRRTIMRAMGLPEDLWDEVVGRDYKTQLELMDEYYKPFREAIKEMHERIYVLWLLH